MHERNSFLTLTYSPEFLPADLSLTHRHFVLFFKRLRERLKPSRILYFMGGEYGERDSRPHYHVCLFGFYPDDIKYWKMSDSGNKIYTSEFLDSVWRLGRVFVGDLTFESASYVARYCMKTEKGVKTSDIFDVETGEIFFRTREYGRMSLNPPIGKRFLDKFGRDIFENDRVISRNFEAPVPRYYDKYLDDIAPLLLADNKDKRRQKALKRNEQFFFPKEPDGIRKAFQRARKQLLVDEVVKKAAISHLKRS